ncbi:MAG: ParA family protein [Actinomycetota bacterium]
MADPTPRPELEPPRPARRGGPVVVAVANAKGGVGKTSIVANLAGLASAGGRRVLTIDLDPQGNLATDFGCKHRSDDGRSLADLLSGRGAVRVVRQVRAGLDIWPGGPALSSIVPGALIPMADDPLAAAIAAETQDYDVVFIDCPPTLGPLVDAGLSAAELLIVPIRADHASLDGLNLIGDRIRTVRERNPGLELLGVVLFDVSRNATALVRDVADALNRDLAGLEPRPLPAIRRSERSAFEMRKAGRLAHEHAASAPTDSPATHLAADYAALAHDVLERIDALADS